MQPKLLLQPTTITPVQSSRARHHNYLAQSTSLIPVRISVAIRISSIPLRRPAQQPSEGISATSAASGASGSAQQSRERVRGSTSTTGTAGAAEQPGQRVCGATSSVRVRPGSSGTTPASEEVG